MEIDANPVIDNDHITKVIGQFGPFQAFWFIVTGKQVLEILQKKYSFMKNDSLFLKHWNFFFFRIVCHVAFLANDGQQVLYW